MDKAKKIEKKKKIKFNVKKPTMTTAPPKAPPKKKFNVVKKAPKKTESFMATPPILPVNETNAKRVLKFMTKVDKEREKRAGITSPSLGDDYFSFKFVKLDGGDLRFLKGGSEDKIEIKKIMKFLKGVKKGEIKLATRMLPKFYKHYLEQVGFNPSVSTDALYKS